ncbi:MAG: hypothetical protein AB7R40_14025 [Nitrospiraceae bacterium]
MVRFVYLRRLFEALIEKARQTAAAEPGWDEAAFKNARMDEKIAILRQHLPKFLVDNRALYGIMSMGVHMLSKARCLEAFPVVRVGIELMLDERLERTCSREEDCRRSKEHLCTEVYAQGK